MKAIPGPYKMIALGETDKTHNEFQFDTKAAIIPLVSSTGHGHASMKRVKYCEGKFALGNILCAVIPNDENFVLAKYLHIYLHWNREELLVSQMKGMANVSLPMNRIADVMVTVPSIEKQREIIELEKQLVEKEIEADKLFADQLTQLDSLNQAILQEAVQGKLVMQDPKDEPASELLKRIKAEKLNKHGVSTRAKKEKPLPPIHPEEIPFEIPENWVWCRLGEICSKIGSGSTPKGSNYSKEGFPFFRSQNIYNDGLVYDDIKFISVEVQKQMNGTIVLANDILLNITGGSMGRCALVPEDFEEGNVSQHVCIIRPVRVDRYYFHKIILSPYFQKFIFSSTTGAGREGLPKYNLEQFVIPLPPLSEQKRIVAEIERQFAKTKALKEHIIANQKATEQLLKALLHQAFEVEEMVIAKPKGKVIELKPTNVDYYRRTVLAAEIVWQLHKEPTLGHLKLQKLIYLCQKSADMQLPTNFLRQAMGPYDNRLMRSIDKQLKEKKWFEYKKDQVFKYQPLEKAGQHQNDFIKYFSAESESIQFIIDKFKTIKSDVVEIVATLYACMDNMLNENVIFSEALLFQRFYEWSEEKKKFSEKEIVRVFSRMKETGIVPNGYNF
jgi:type I restriction enzyme S subunit